MKFAYLILGDYEGKKASIGNGSAQIIGVADVNEACEIAKQLCEEGITCIELCGAFGPEGAKKVVDAVESKIPIGYATHLPEQEEVYQTTFSK